MLNCEQIVQQIYFIRLIVVCFLFFLAIRALWLFIFGTLTLVISCSYCGLLIYATYHDCDPLTTKLVKAKDQLLPLLVMRLFGDYPGLPGLLLIIHSNIEFIQMKPLFMFVSDDYPGLFVSGVFSAALR